VIFCRISIYGRNKVFRNGSHRQILEEYEPGYPAGFEPVQVPGPLIIDRSLRIGETEASTLA
jgi:hypothetical protein